MPWGLKRFQKSRQLHFLTFSCFHRRPNFATPTSRTTFESSLERVRRAYGLWVYGYVVMPEHVHLLVSEPERDTLARAMQSLKQSVARRLALRAADPFWQARYYDFNVWSEMKFVEKLRYIHRNPVKRGLVAQPEDWAWSSFRHYLTGEASAVEIESQWTARRREQVGIFPTVRTRSAEEKPRPSEAWTGVFVGRRPCTRGRLIPLPVAIPVLCRLAFFRPYGCVQPRKVPAQAELGRATLGSKNVIFQPTAEKLSIGKNYTIGLNCLHLIQI
jgi:putative transposase